MFAHIKKKNLRGTFVKIKVQTINALTPDNICIHEINFVNLCIFCGLRLQ